MQFTIRRAEQADNQRIRPLQKQIADLHHAGKPNLFRIEPRNYSEEEFARILADPDQIVFIAQEPDGRVIGYAFAQVLHVRNHPTYVDFDRFYIGDICVREECRGNGVGSALFALCRSQAEERGCALMDLGVFGFNRAAIAFYEKCGMSEQQRRMELVLQPGGISG